MATGKPYLLTWRQADGITRLFRQNADNVFVQLASLNAFTHDSTLRLPKFIINDTDKALADQVFIWSQATSQNSINRNHNLTTLALIDTVTPTSPAPPLTASELNSTKIVFDYCRKSKVALAYDNNNHASAHGLYIDASIGQVLADYMPLASTVVSAVAIHPNEEAIFVGAPDLGSAVWKPTGTNTVLSDPDRVYNKFEQSNINQKIALTDLEGNPTCARWSPDGRYLFVGIDDGSYYVYEWDSEAQTCIQKFYDTSFVAYGGVTDIKIRRDSRYVALSCHNASLATPDNTIILYRTGFITSEKRTITGFGITLDFTDDGQYLIDAGSQKAVQFDAASDSWIDDNAIMANIPAGVSVQALSYHIPNDAAFGFIYDVAVTDIANQTLPLSNLKVLLLNSSAKFDHTDSDVSLITTDGTTNFEVTGMGWPSGGVALSNVHYGELDGNFALLADEVKQIVVHSMTFRYALVYEATDNIPIVLLDIGPNGYTSEEQTTLVFDFATHGIVQFQN